MLAAVAAVMFAGTGRPRRSSAAHSAARTPLAAALQRRWPEIAAAAAAPPRGQPQTRYTLAEFGDFQCRQCRDAAPLLNRLLSQFPGEVNLIFVHSPLPRIHSWALAAAQTSQIAAAQGRFWPMYDLLYAHQDELDGRFCLQAGAQVGLPEAELRAAARRGEGRAEVMEAKRLTESLGIRETPTLALHDNATGTVTVYVGVSGSEAPGPDSPPGLQLLLDSPPWASAPAPRRL